MKIGFWQIIHRLRFTMITEGLLLATALITGSYAGELSPLWLARLGFAPADLLTPDFWRIATSAVVTSGQSGLLAAMAAVGVVVGLGEWMLGSRRTAHVFWGVHVASLLVESLFFAFPLYRHDAPMGKTLVFSRDVGASAGYFGVLGFIIARLKRPWNWFGGAIIFTGLAVILWRFLAEKRSGADVSAALAHLIAFPLGWLIVHPLKNLKE